VEVAALRWHRRLALVQQLLEERLLAQRVHQLHRRDDVLGFDDTPAAAGEETPFR
jgi:hypothetical protein